MGEAGSMEKIFIGISGLIGAGKTTLARALGEKLDLETYYEPVKDNVYLSDFYKDLSRYGFPMQIHLLNKRFHQHQMIIWRGEGGVQDRTIYEDTIFARMLMKSGYMDPRDYETYVDLFKNMSNFMCKPNVIIYLDVKPEIAAARIRERARNIETGISLDYLKNLHSEYEVFIEDISRVIPVIRVGWNEYQETEAVIEAIRTEYSKTSFLRQVLKWE